MAIFLLGIVFANRYGNWYDSFSSVALAVKGVADTESVSWEIDR